MVTATTVKNRVGARKLAKIGFFAILFVFGQEALAIPTQVTWGMLYGAWNATINCSSSPSNPTCSFQTRPGYPVENIHIDKAPATYNLTNLPVLNETIIIKGTAYPTLDNSWNSNTIQTLHKWVEIRDTNCSGALIATRDIPGGRTNFISSVGYATFNLDPVPVTPGQTYGFCLNYTPTAVPAGYLSSSEYVNFDISYGGIVDLPSPPAPVYNVPALPWQAEILFAAFLLATGLWIGKKKKAK